MAGEISIEHLASLTARAREENGAVGELCALVGPALSAVASAAEASLRISARAAAVLPAAMRAIELQDPPLGHEDRRALVEGLVRIHFTAGAALSSAAWRGLLDGLAESPRPSVRNQAGRLFGDLASLAESYPREVAAIASVFVTHPKTDAKLVWRHSAEIWDHMEPDEDQREKLSAALESAMLAPAPRGSEIMNALKGRVTLTSQGNLREIANLLDMARDVALSSLQRDDDGVELLEPPAMRLVKSMFQECLRGSSGSLLAQLRMRQLVEDLSSEPEGLDFEDQPRVFQVDRARVGYAARQVRISHVSDRELVNEAMDLIDELQRELHAGGDVVDDEFARRVRLRKRTETNLLKYIREELPLDDLPARRIDRSDLEASSLGDTKKEYPVLLRAPYRDLVEKHLGVPLWELGLRDQFYLLRFLRFLEPGHFPAVCKFARRYGSPGLRAYLAVDYGVELGRELTGLGLRVQQNEGRLLFGEFAKLIDSARSFGGEICLRAKGRELAQGAKLPEFAEQMEEAFVRRSKDLLVAASRILQAPPGDLGIREVLVSLRGLRTLLEMLSDRHRQERYSFAEESGEAWLRKYLVKDREGQHDYRIKIFLRPCSNAEGEARINCELCFDTDRPDGELAQAFRQTTVRKNTKKPKIQTDSTLRVAIDLDGFYAKIERYGRPLASLDVGRNPYSGQTFERSGDILGRLLSLGRSAGNHNVDSFAPSMSDPEVFAGLVESFRAAFF